VVDNLTMKHSLIYADVKQCLMDMDTSEPEGDTTLYTYKPSGNQKKGKKPNGVPTLPHRNLHPALHARNIILGSPKDIPGMSAFACRN